MAWIVGVVKPLFTVLGQEISGRDLILILGGLFLVWKSTTEIYGSFEGEEGHAAAAVKAQAGEKKWWTCTTPTRPGRSSPTLFRAAGPTAQPA